MLLILSSITVIGSFVLAGMSAAVFHLNGCSKVFKVICDPVAVNVGVPSILSEWL